MYLMQLFLLLVLVMISVNHAVRGYRHARSTQIRKVFSLRAGAYSSLSAASDIPYASSSSAKVASLFYKQEDSATGKVDNDIDIEKVLLVPSSEFDKFKSEILDLSEQSLSMLEDAGISLNKFPGIKVIKVPLKWCNQPTNVAFYDDKVSSNKIIFSPLFSHLRATTNVVKAKENKGKNKDTKNKDKDKNAAGKENTTDKVFSFVSMDGSDSVPAEVAARLLYVWAETGYKLDMFKKKGYADNSASSIVSSSSASNTRTDKDKKQTNIVKICIPCSVSESQNDKTIDRSIENELYAIARANYLMKDLVDSPALTLGPAELASVVEDIANEYNADVTTLVGKELLGKNNSNNNNNSDINSGGNIGGYPQVYAVGMAASEGREPRVVEFTWDPTKAGINMSDTEVDILPEVVLIGKGITFDTGGLNIKGGMGMKAMKKDMAGSAQCLALASLCMHTKMPIKLRVLIPIAENSISGVALRPGDVIRARNGKTSEITNTDAEGRLILADCLVAACETESRYKSRYTSTNKNTNNNNNTNTNNNNNNNKDNNKKKKKRKVIIDFATLTGAARVALGPEIPALFSNDHAEQMKLFNLSNNEILNFGFPAGAGAGGVAISSFAAEDPMWPMPLWENMRKDLKSSIADLVNAPGGQGGAITAALYLSEFISPLGNAHLSALSVDMSGEGEGEGEGKEVPIWFHIDFMGSKGGRAEPQGMRAVYAYLRNHLQ